MIRDLQDGVAVSEVAIDEFIANAERRGWPEVARAGLFTHVVKVGLFTRAVASAYPSTLFENETVPLAEGVL